MSIAVREATPTDAAAIADIHVRAWQVAYEGIVPARYLDDLDIEERTALWTRILQGDLVVEGIPRPLDVVAIADGRVVGFANVGRFRDQPDDHRSGELWAMYATPSSWGSGVGHVLMEATIDEFRRSGCDRAFLWVLTENRRARRFYERHGWSVDGENKTLEIGGAEIAEVRYSLDLASVPPSSSAAARG